jgi:hypothetical protein
MSRTQVPPGDTKAAKPPLSEGVRTAISFLLFVHLFALGLLFLSNFEGGDWDSLLLSRMKVVVRPYLYPLWLDRPYHYHLTYAQPLDYDHYVDIAWKTSDSAQETVLRLPPDDLSGGLRRQRYERLAWHFARAAEVGLGDEVLPLALGAGILRQYDVDRVQVRLFRKRPLFFDEVRSGVVNQAPDERLYAADVFFLPGYAEPQLNKIGVARDVAPVTRPAEGSNRSPSPSSSKDGKDSSSGDGKTSQPTRSLLLPGSDPGAVPIPPTPANRK